MSWLVRMAILAVALSAGLQWVVPHALAGGIASALASWGHGPKPQVSVTAIPFWEATQGKFQDIYIHARQFTAGPLLLSQLTMNWQNGRVNVGDLMHKRLTVMDPGSMQLRVRVDQAALTQLLKHSNIPSVKGVKVSIAPHQVTLSGTVRLHAMDVPLIMSGPLTLSGDRSAVEFHPQKIDGLNIPVATRMTIFTVAELKLPVRLHLTSLQLSSGAVELGAAGP